MKSSWKARGKPITCHWPSVRLSSQIQNTPPIHPHQMSIYVIAIFCRVSARALRSHLNSTSSPADRLETREIKKWVVKVLSIIWRMGRRETLAHIKSDSERRKNVSRFTSNYTQTPKCLPVGCPITMGDKQRSNEWESGRLFNHCSARWLEGERNIYCVVDFAD